MLGRLGDHPPSEASARQSDRWMRTYWQGRLDSVPVGRSGDAMPNGEGADFNVIIEEALRLDCQNATNW